MKNYVVEAGILSAIFLVFLFGFALSFYNTEERVVFDSQHTKAICSGGECRDYLITCSAGEAVEIEPITEIVIFGDEWEDPRELDDRTISC